MKNTTAIIVVISGINIVLTAINVNIMPTGYSQGVYHPEPLDLSKGPVSNAEMLEATADCVAFRKEFKFKSDLDCLDNETQVSLRESINFLKKNPKVYEHPPECPPNRDGGGMLAHQWYCIKLARDPSTKYQ